MELAPGVHQFRLPIPDNPLIPDQTLGEAFSYLVETEDGYVLIDAGWDDPVTFESLLSHLQSIGVAPDAIQWIVLTHYHPDHFGVAQKLREISGAKLAMHHLDLPDSIREHYLSKPDAAADWIRQWRLSQGLSEAESADMPSPKYGISIYLPPVKLDVSLSGGESLDDGAASLEAIWTPGHTPGHICIYDKRRKLLFSGDQVLPQITPHISVHPHTQGDPLGEFLDSLERLDKLEVSMVLPGHEYSFIDLHQRIAELAHHHQVRLDETLAALESGPKITYEVASWLTWNVGNWEDMKPFSRQLAMFETLAHLRHLQHQGIVHCSCEKGRDFYEKV